MQSEWNTLYKYTKENNDVLVMHIKSRDKVYFVKEVENTYRQIKSYFMRF